MQWHYKVKVKKYVNLIDCILNNFDNKLLITKKNIKIILWIWFKKWNLQKCYY